MKLYQSGIILLLLGCAILSSGQNASFDSFITQVSSQYKVDIALAPELVPLLDSLKKDGQGFTGLEDFLQQILKDKQVAYQIVDGNKILLRREIEMYPNAGKLLITGIIVDGSNQAPLPYVALSIQNTPHGTYTDEQGRFSLFVDDATSTLQINYLGFKPITVSVAEFIIDQKKVEMEVDQIRLSQVMIVVPYHQLLTNPENQSLDLKGYQFISKDELLSRNTETLVRQLTGYTHFSSEQGIRIRGSEEENSLIIMDGIPVYDPYHYYNIFSPFNGHYFSSVRLYKNNIPVEYGGRVDGMIEVNSTSDKSEPKLILDSDLLMTSIAGELPLTDKIKFTAGWRISHTELLKESLRDSSTTNFISPGKFRDENEWTSSQQPLYNFYDINLGLNVNIGNNKNLSLNYFKSEDDLDNLVRNDLTTTLQNKEIISFKQTIINKDTWQNEGLSVSFQSPLTEKIVFNLTGYLSSFEKNLTYNAMLEEVRPIGMRTSANTGLQSSVLQTTGVKAFIQEQHGGTGNFILGIDLQKHDVDLLAKENTTPYLLEVQRENEATLFGEYTHTLFEKLDVSIGGRLTYLTSTSELYPQPNLIFTLPAGEWTLKASYSKNIQSVRELTVENRFGREVEFLALSQPDAGYPVISADKYMIGATFRMDHINVDGEFYYKKTDGLLHVRALRPDPSFIDPASPLDFYRLFTGDGWTAGFDLTASYKMERTEVSLSYTLSKISQQFDHLFNGSSFSPTEDRRHQVKLSSQHKMGPFIASGLLTYKTKAPYVSLIRLQGQGGIGMVEQAMVLRYLPAYFSLDLGLDYSFNIANQQAQFGLSLINATNHENINDLQHIGRIARNAAMGELFLTHETELLGRTFNVHFRMLLD